MATPEAGLPAATLPEAILRVRDLHVAYGKRLVLRGVEFDVAAGEVVTLLGANGSGKSTILNAISGFVRPSRGVIEFDGVDIAGFAPHRTFRHRVVQISQARNLFPDMDVEDNVRLGALMRPDAKEAARDLELVYDYFPRLAERRRLRARALSGGEQQMVAFARALMGRARMLLLDEPSGGLSPQFVQEIAGIIQRLKGEGTTMLLVEQNVNLALDVADRFVILRDGLVLEGGSVQGLSGDKSEIVRAIYL